MAEGAESGTNPDAGSQGFQINNPLPGVDNPVTLINKIIGGLLPIAVALTSLVILWGAFQLLSSSGNPEKIERGKKTILWAVIGLVIVLVAQGIAFVIQDVTGIKVTQ